MHPKRAYSRRRFLAAGSKLSLAVSATFAAPSLFFNRTLAAAGENPSNFVRVGFIGVGNQGGGNLRKLMRNAVAVCDVDSSRAAEARKRVEEANKRACTSYSDYRRMLESKDIDAVVITTPDHWHALPTIHACQAGKDVYCEKPLTLTIGEGQAMVKAARRHDRVVQTGSQQRSDAKFLKACEYIRNGRLGTIRRVLVGLSGVNWTKEPAVPDSAPPPELDYDRWLGPAPARPYNKHRVHYYFRFFWDYSGGQMTNWGAHHLDITQWALGKDSTGPVQVKATGNFDPEKRFEVPNGFQITYKYSDDIVVECRSPDLRIADVLGDRKSEALKVLDNKERFTGCIFEGEKGLLYINRGVIRCDPPGILEEPLKESDTRLYSSNDHFQNWLSCIKSRALPICDVEIGHRSATVCHLGNIAIRTGQELRWDPAKEQITNLPQAENWVNKPYRSPWKLPT